jgi:mono/diheme cytochrome c family protein
VLGREPDLRADAVQVLGTTAEGTRYVGKLFVEKKLPRELLTEVSEALRKYAARDEGSAQLLAEVMRAGLKTGTSAAEVERVRKLVKEKGNPSRGRARYLNAKTLACINCHKLEGMGGNVGPDPTRIWETHTVEKIIESIAEPSKEIKEGYQTYQATTGCTCASSATGCAWPARPSR